MNSALANLTANYTDSENEEDLENRSPDSDTSSHDSQIIRQKTPIHKSPAPSSSSQSAIKSASSSVSNLRLVSYHDDTVVSDEENEKQEMLHKKIVTSEEESENLKQTIASEELNTSLKDKYAYYGFSLPQIPKGKPPQELVEKIRNLHEKMEKNNMDMNKIIQERKDFRNPSIYEKLIQFCDINEFGTNYPPEIYDPLQWGPESYYEELAKVQKTEMLKKQKERKEIDKVELATAAAKKAEEEAKKRKSKWDQPAPVPSTSNVKSNLSTGTFTATVTGTKGTVISAFGTLPKKLAM